jgi:hypothetical protein
MIDLRVLKNNSFFIEIFYSPNMAPHPEIAFGPIPSPGDRPGWSLPHAVPFSLRSKGVKDSKKLASGFRRVAAVAPRRGRSSPALAPPARPRQREMNASTGLRASDAAVWVDFRRRASEETKAPVVPV